MPMYEYECSNCGNRVTELRWNSEKDLEKSVNPCNCNGFKMNKVFSLTVGRVQAGTPRFSRNSKDKNV